MRSKQLTEDDLREAFLLGFMVTREGFCAESMIDDLAPNGFESDYIDGERSFAKEKEDVQESPEFLRLRELAVERIVRAKSF